MGGKVSGQAHVVYFTRRPIRHGDEDENADGDEARR